MKKVIGDYLSFIPRYKDATFKMWDLTLKVTSWVVRILKKLDLNLEFHFIKNGNQGEKNATEAYGGLNTQSQKGGPPTKRLQEVANCQIGL